MKTQLYTLLSLAASIAALPAVTVDFNQPNDLDDNFAIAIYNDGSAANLPAINTTSGGLGNSGAIGGTQHLSSQAIIYTSGFTLEQGSTYTVSAYFKGAAYNGVGFTNGTAPTMLFLPEVSISYLGSVANDLYLTNYRNQNDQDWQYAEGTLTPYAADAWIFRTLSLTYNGAGEFLLSYATHISNADGVLGDLANSGSYTFINPELNNTIYAYVFRDQSTQTDMAIDNFTAVVPEPATYATLAAIGMLAVVMLRRRSHS